jgi:hypothetical protein
MHEGVELGHDLASNELSVHVTVSSVAAPASVLLGWRATSS